MVAEVSPAKAAAAQAMEQVIGAIEGGRSFVLEAGAGAGKTYSLVQALQHVIDARGTDYLRSGRQIACITYTNVASDEIKDRTASHPAVESSTIHSFCWGLIKNFQKKLRESLSDISDKWRDRLEEAGGHKDRHVIYDLGHAEVLDDRIMLGHSDIVPLFVKLMQDAKFRALFQARFPVVFIDEYQDTSTEFVGALKTYFLDKDTGPLLGFFGDHWQKIYGDGCGKIEHPQIREITKQANFRSRSAIIDFLNNLRPELKQFPKDLEPGGQISIFHTNDWTGQRRTDGHSRTDLPPEAISTILNQVRTQLTGYGWQLNGCEKVLMLTHRGLATQQGYEGLLGAVRPNERLIKKEDPVIEYLLDMLEPAIRAFEAKKYGEMFLCLGRRNVPRISKASEKQDWQKLFTNLLKAREAGTIGQMLEAVRSSPLIRLPDRVAELLSAHGSEPEGQSDVRALLAVPYKEIVGLKDFMDEHTPFSTQHGVKGAEFEEVIVICGKGWNHYDFNGFLELCGMSIPASKTAGFERARNLFYVSCSRPKERLAILFTEPVSDKALSTLKEMAPMASVESLM